MAVYFYMLFVFFVYYLCSECILYHCCCYVCFFICNCTSLLCLYYIHVLCYRVVMTLTSPSTQKTQTHWACQVKPRLNRSRLDSIRNVRFTTMGSDPHAATVDKRGLRVPTNVRIETKLVCVLVFYFLGGCLVGIFLVFACLFGCVYLHLLLYLLFVYWLLCNYTYALHIHWIFVTFRYMLLCACVLLR